MSAVFTLALLKHVTWKGLGACRRHSTATHASSAPGSTSSFRTFPVQHLRLGTRWNPAASGCSSTRLAAGFPPQGNYPWRIDDSSADVSTADHSRRHRQPSVSRGGGLMRQASPHHPASTPGLTPATAAPSNPQAGSETHAAGRLSASPKLRGRSTRSRTTARITLLAP